MGLHDIIYSIIIPHKNIPVLLQRCLNSIPRSSEIQIIVVDDNSNPDIVDFEKFPGLDDPYVEIYFNKENKGAGFARNLGMSKAKGKWLLFADSDDFYSENFMNCINNYKDSTYDIIYFSIQCVDNQSLKPNPKVNFLLKYMTKYVSNPHKYEYLFRYAFPQPWAKMVRSELVRGNNIKFDETIVANDYSFSIFIGFYAKNICVDSNKLYIYTVRSNSLSSVVCDTKEKLMARLYVYHRVYSFLKEKKVKYNEKYLFGLITGLFFKNTEFFILSYKYLRTNKMSNFSIIINMINSFFYLIQNKSKKIIKG